MFGLVQFAASAGRHGARLFAQPAFLAAMIAAFVTGACAATIVRARSSSEAAMTLAFTSSGRTKSRPSLIARACAQRVSAIVASARHALLLTATPLESDALERYEAEAEGIEKKYQRGALNKQERNDALVELWKEATEEVGQALRARGRLAGRRIIVVGAGQRRDARAEHA